MEQNLQTVIDFINQNIHLSQEEKTSLISNLKETDKKITITEFKLDRTEKVKRTTAILLEETIEELEQKRKAVEAQNRELEIESSLERVRTIALSMNNPDDMLQVCRIISEQLENLGIHEVRNVQTAIFYKEKGTYMNYEYYAKHDNTFITETTYTNNEKHAEFAESMQKGNGGFFELNMNGNEVKDWIEYQKTTNVFIDDFLYNASSLNYYWFSLGSVALGISTYEPLKENDTNLFKRFVKVFELAYRRYLDIEKAIVQAREAKIETGLERVRSRSMAMHNTSELQEVIHTVHKELLNLDIAIHGGSFIAINSDIETQLRCWGSGGTADTSEEVHIPLYEKPFCTNLINRIKNGPGFFTEAYTQKEKKDFFTFLFKNEPWSKLDAKQKKETLLSEGGYTRSCCISQHTSIFIVNQNGKEFSDADNDILKRFGKVFEQTYTRFLDLQKAEAQAREAEIQLALERVRAKSLAMHNTFELQEVVNIAAQQLHNINIDINGGVFITINDEVVEDLPLWASQGAADYVQKVVVPSLNKPFFIQLREAIKKRNNFYIEQSTREEKNQLFKHLFKHAPWNDLAPGRKKELLSREGGLSRSVAVSQHTSIAITNHNGKRFSDNDNEILKRFGKVFEQTYTRFLDLQKAEAQAREAKIEAALEKVRSRSLAMHTSEELGEIITVVLNNLQELGYIIDEGAAAHLAIFSEGTKDFVQWSADPTLTSPVRSFIPFTDLPILTDFLDAKKQGLDFFANIYPFDEKNTWFNYAFEHSDLRHLPGDLKHILLQSETYAHSIAFEKNSAIIINSITGNQLSENQIDILKRFSKVFEQAYIRFLDLQKAETQAREAKIEVALEQIRSRSLAMHHSGELKDVVDVMFNKLDELKVLHGTVAIQLFDFNTKDSFFWPGNTLNKKPPLVKLPFDKNIMNENTCHRDLWQAMISGEAIFNKVYSLKQKDRWFQYVFEHNDLATISLETREFILQAETHTVCFIPLKNSALFADSWEGSVFSEEEFRILKKTAKVFEQAYTRFLDLQKAEAQAIEAKIELALERVRARTMAMQRSDELSDAAVLLFQQVKSFGLESWSCGFNIWEKDEKVCTSYVTSPEGKLVEPFQIPLTEDPIFIRFYESKQKGQDFWMQEISGQEEEDHYKYLCSLPVLGDMLKKLPEAGIPFPTFQIDHVVNFSHGNLLFITYEPVPYAHEIFKRFGKVFDQTYTRFLDLKKAEAQAREAQIETALERVRSRSLAMHKTDELQEVVTVVLDRMTDLNIELDSININIYKEGLQEAHLWTAAPGLKYAIPFHLPFFDHPFHTDIFTAKENGLDFFTKTYSYEEKNSYFNYTFEHSDFKHVPEAKKKLIMEGRACTRSIAITKNVGIFIHRYSEKVFSESENEILKRFAKVFEQAYTRFLDLQKAEAQAKEAQIELGLERVRARAMAMQTSEELKELIGTVFTELTKLDLILIGSVIIIFDPETNSSRWWMVNSNAPSEPLSFFIKYHEHIPYLEFIKAWKERKLRWEYKLQGSTKKEWDEFLFNQTELASVPAPVIAGMKTPKRILLSTSFNNFGCLNVGTLNPLTEEQFDILLRFAKVFDLTYTRFNDLQKAEAQAREANIEAALERVRSRTMAMHKSDELQEVSKIIIQQIVFLNFPLFGFGIHICHENEPVSEAWIGDPTKGQVPTVRYEHTHDSLSKLMYKGWKEGESLLVKKVEGEKLKEHFDYMVSITPISSIFEPATAPEFIIYHFAYFSHGFFVIAMLSRYEEAPTILKRFAKVFEQTYTRFLDLQKAEAQSREAQIELALERVRARTMAMQKSEELHETSQILFQQMNELGELVEQLTIGIINETENVVEIFATVQGSQLQQAFRHSIDEPIVMNKIYKGWKAQQKSLLVEMGSEEIQAYNRYRNELVKSEMFSTTVSKDDRRIIYAAYFSKGMLALGSNTPQSEDSHRLLERFAGVFDSTYTRFLDLQKAEANAKEAKIEAALEKIRSRSLAMHNSSELKEIITIFFEKLNELGVLLGTVGLGFFDSQTKNASYWVGTTLQDPQLISAPYSEDIMQAGNFLADNWKAMADKKEIINKRYSKEQKDKYFKHIFAHNSLSQIPENVREFLISMEIHVNCFFPFVHSGLFVDSFDGTLYTDEGIQILRRAGKVFEQAYIRFLDLQKAEAQAREAKIEAALERVRSKTIAMQRSDELTDAAMVMFQQLKELGVNAFACGFVILDKSETEGEFWMSSEGVFQPPHYIPNTEEPAVRNMYTHWEKNEEFYAEDVGGEALKSHYKYLMELPKSGPNFQGLLDAGITFPEWQRMYAAYFSNGYLLIITKERYQEENIFKRFAKVFEQTYTRFLDLQKAEAQAREAQIEAALEKIRSRSLGMHHSVELKDVVAILFQKLKELDLVFDGGAAFHLFTKGSKDAVIWVASPLNEPSRVNLPYDEKAFENNPIILDVWHAKESGEHIHNKFYSFEEKNRYFDYVFKHNDFIAVPKYVREFIPQADSYTANFIAEKNSLLGVNSWTRQLFSDDDFEVLKRVARVFEQAYIRFLDLQKAEAQARESQIELALERVRARTMAMKKSDQLAETAAVLFKQLINLGIEPNRLYINIVKSETGDAEFWITDEDGSKVSMAYADNMNNNPTFKTMFDGWKQQKKSLLIDMKGKELQQYFNYLNSIHVPFKGGLTQKRRIQYIAYFSKGLIGMASPDEQPAETLQLLERFASVFNLTFTRFNDLQIAEAHALQAEEDLVKLQKEKKRAENALTELQAAQKQLIQSEKMASLGELTAGIAHEIQNPLNFVNNFSEVSNELIDEMMEEVANGNYDDVKAIANYVKENLEKIAHHGKRADNIVKGMLQHSRTGSGQKELTDINSLADEYMRLCYHGLRSKDKTFNATLETNYDKSIGMINIIPQDIGRVIINLITNAFYAVNEKSKKSLNGYLPTVSVSTQKFGDKVSVSIKDNGNGIPQYIIDKIFQPFFTTKPTGQGTGLGLSLAYDIVKAQDGELKVETKEGEGSTFIILLPATVEA